MADEARGERAGLAGGGDDVEVADRLLPAPGRPRDGDLERGRLVAQVRHDPFADREGVREQHPALGGALSHATHAVQDPLLGLRAEALHAADAPGAAGRLELGDRAHPERRVERRDLLRAEVRHLEQLEDAGRVLRAQPVEQRERAGAVQLGDLLRERLADAGHLGEAPGLDLGAEVLEASTARAPFSYARTLNGFSPSSSRNVPSSRSARATANLSSIGRYI